MSALDISSFPPTITAVFDARNRCPAARVNLAPGTTPPPGLLALLGTAKTTGSAAASAIQMPLLIEASDPQWWAQTLGKTLFSCPLHLLLPVECFADPEAQAALAELDGRAVTLMARGIPADDSFFHPLGIDVTPGLNSRVTALLHKIKGPHLAIGVDSHATHLRCLKAGFHWFEGAWLLQPETEHEVRAITSRGTLLNLLRLVVGDADISQIEALFKRDPNLSYQLLKLVNSVSFSLPQKIRSFHHAITILGHRQLQRWLQLLLFAGHYSDGTACALLGVAARRAAFMEALVEARGGRQEDKDRAFMVGLFSLLDVLFNVSIGELVTPINLEDEIARALISHDGILGRLLNLAIATETEPGAALTQGLAELAIAPDVFMQVQLEAMSWAMQVCKEF